MSKETVLNFFVSAAKDKELKNQLENAKTQAELVDVGSKAGYDFSTEHVDEAMDELQQKPGFFGALIAAALEVFSPDHDDYPATGVQPFSGDPNPNP